MILHTISIVLISGQLGMDTGQMVPIGHTTMRNMSCAASLIKGNTMMQRHSSICQRNVTVGVKVQRALWPLSPDPCTLVCIPWLCTLTGLWHYYGQLHAWHKGWTIYGVTWANVIQSVPFIMSLFAVGGPLFDYLLFEQCVGWSGCSAVSPPAWRLHPLSETLTHFIMLYGVSFLEL